MAAGGIVLVMSWSDSRCVAQIALPRPIFSSVAAPSSPASAEEAGQAPYRVPVPPLQQGPGQRHGAADHLGPQQPGLRVGAEQLRLPVTAVLIQPPRPGLGAEDAGQADRLQQFPGQEEQILALRGEMPRPFLVFGQQEVSVDGRPDGLPEG